MSTFDDAAFESYDNARLARRLIRASAHASLASADTTRASWPYASLVITACDIDAAPLLLLSELAVHSRNIGADGRISLLYCTPGNSDDALTRPRVTIFGEARRDTHPDARDRFLARHPDATVYIDFADFHLYRIAVAGGHLVADFGRIVDLDGADLACAAGPLAGAAAGIVTHMNNDHTAALDGYANILLGRNGAGWQMTGIDAEGCDLRRSVAPGDGDDAHLARLDFDKPVGDATTARAELVRLAKTARQPS
jgi:putative heme iron utilization protein